MPVPLTYLALDGCAEILDSLADLRAATGRAPALSLVVPKEEGQASSLASYQLDVLRDKNRELNRRLTELFGNAQDNERLAVRTHQLSLALMRASRMAR